MDGRETLRHLIAAAMGALIWHFVASSPVREAIAGFLTALAGWIRS